MILSILKNYHKTSATHLSLNPTLYYDNITPYISIEFCGKAAIPITLNLIITLFQEKSDATLSFHNATFCIIIYIPYYYV